MPRNSAIIGEVKDGYKVWEVVVFQCIRGYILASIDYSVCQADGNWTSVDVKCMFGDSKRDFFPFQY